MKYSQAIKKTFIFFLFFIVIHTTEAQSGSDTIDFESVANDLLIDSSQINNLWQIGKPHKVLFDTAYNSQHAIVTDTLNFYPNNSISSFTFKIFPLAFDPWNINWPGPYPYVIFSHKFNTDTLADGGYIEYSVDGGLNWQNVTDYEDYGIVPNIANSITIPHYTGEWNTWFTTRISFLSFSNIYSGVPDSMLIKFSFVSDSLNTNKEGWIIDNIVYGTDIGEGLQTNKNKIDCLISPNPFNSSTTIEIIGNTKAPFNFTLFDQLGMKVKQIDNINQSKFKIERNELPSGMYFYRIQGKKSHFITTGKLIIGN